MDYLTILTICGIVVGVITTAIGTYITMKRRQTAKLTFFEENVIPLFDVITKNLPDITIYYHGKPISRGLILLKGVIVNTGARDITNEMVVEKVSFNLPDGFKWHSVKLLSQSPKVNGEIVHFDDNLVFSLGLFKPNEYIRFHALAENLIPEEASAEEVSNVEDEFVKALTITHRIAVR
ncbi:MAG: hypothetical protein ACYS67_17055 [Planctomycetota bacterium]|jgi:hypothetical protein